MRRRGGLLYTRRVNGNGNGDGDGERECKRPLGSDWARALRGPRRRELHVEAQDVVEEDGEQTMGEEYALPVLRDVHHISFASNFTRLDSSVCGTHDHTVWSFARPREKTTYVALCIALTLIIPHQVEPLRCEVE